MWNLHGTCDVSGLVQYAGPSKPDRYKHSLLFLGGLLGPANGAMPPISPGIIWKGRFGVAIGSGTAPFLSGCILALACGSSLECLACGGMLLEPFVAANCCPVKVFMIEVACVGVACGV